MTQLRTLTEKISEAIPFGEFFTLTPTGVKVKGKPSLEEFQGVLAFVTNTHKASGWWLVDLIAYADSRTDWDQHIDAIIDSELMAEATIKQYRWLGKKLPTTKRMKDVGFAQHLEVASVEPEEQGAWLHRAKENQWTSRELRDEIRASKRVRIIEGQARLAGRYRVILADCPWSYSDSDAVLGSTAGGKALAHYPTMSIEQIMQLPVEAHSTPDAVLFLYATAPLLMQNPGPRDVMEAWGFTYKSNLVWNKVLGMPGHYGMQVVHEHLLIGTRGSCTPDHNAPVIPSVFTERRGEEHSGKPEAIRKWIENKWTEGNKLELFAREQHKGWTSYGNDPRLWVQTA